MKDPLVLCKVAVAARSQSLNITFMEPCRVKKKKKKFSSDSDFIFCSGLLSLFQSVQLVESCTKALTVQAFIPSRATSTDKLCSFMILVVLWVKLPIKWCMLHEVDMLG